MKFLLVAVLISTSAAHASLGNDAGGGGNAVVCRDSKEKILTAETLDVFEARVLHQLTVPLSSVVALDQVFEKSREIDRINEGFQASATLREILPKIRFIPSELKLEPIEDNFPVVNQKGCHIEQLARYLSTNELLIDSEIWGALNETNRAALYLHEVVYKQMRLEGAKNSLRARHIVSYVMSDFVNNFWPSVFPSAEVPISLFCYSPNAYPYSVAFKVALRKNAEGESVADLYFSRLGNRMLFERVVPTIYTDTFFTSPRKQDSISGSTSGGFEQAVYLEMVFQKKIQNELVYRLIYDSPIGSEDGGLSSQVTTDIRCQQL